MLLNVTTKRNINRNNSIRITNPLEIATDQKELFNIKNYHVDVVEFAVFAHLQVY